MRSIGLSLPCGRNFAQFGAKIIDKILSMPCPYRRQIYVAAKASNLTNAIINDGVNYIIEPETNAGSIMPTNLIYQQVKEDYFITLNDDFIVRRDFYGIVDFIEENKSKNIPPIAALGVSGIRLNEVGQPNEITYHNGPHPVYRAIPWWAHETKWMKSLFPGDLHPSHELHNFYSDELLAFRIQHRYRFVIPVWRNDAIFVPDLPPTHNRHGQRKYDLASYKQLISKMEQTPLMI